MTPKEELKARALPPLMTREEMREILQSEVYGYLPSCAYTLRVSEPITVEARYAVGCVEHSYVTLTVAVAERSHSFRVDRLLHRDGGRHPLIVYNNFHPELKSPYFPTEELSESDADFLVVYYREVTSDDGDFENGLAPLLLPDGQRRDTDCGKIGVWAWAAMRVLDYGLTLEGTDAERVGIAGHSRLGKTALYAAMLDERFTFTLSNAAGCTGDALSHGNSGLCRTARTFESGELIEDIVSTFPYWFCKNYKKYAEHNVSDTFDQHFLLGAIAPRYVLVGSCSEDHWADPRSQFLCAMAAAQAWEREGLDGLVAPDRYPETGESFLNGHVGFYCLKMKHFMSRHGWRHFLDFIKNHGKCK